MDIKDITCTLADAPGVSGAESAITAAEEILGKFAEVRRDAMGSIIGTVGEGKTHIMLDAHLDRIGLIVTAIGESGFLRVDKCGGCDARVLSAAEVTVLGKKNLYGVVTSTPPHLAKSEDASKAPDFDSIYVDLGLPCEEVKKYVSVGDRITIDAPVINLNDNIISSAALDDRIGMAAIIRTLDIIKDKKPKVRVSALFSVQEETTEAGGKTGAFRISPDEAVAVDVSFARAPSVSETEGAKLGKGGMICVSSSLNADMSNELMQAAEKNGIPYQIEVCPSSTGTNADVIAVSKQGIRTGLVSIPIRNMHTQAELADLRDVESTAQIIAAYIISKGESENA